MIRRGRPNPGDETVAQTHVRELTAAQSHLRSRRRFLIASAGGSLAMLFGIPAVASETNDPWPVLELVLNHLLPSEPDSPGAAEINALDYLRFVVADPKVDREEREFILQGVSWLEELARQSHPNGFIALDETARDALLRQIASSPAGENWLATLLSYLFEALLTAPVYGGNPGGIGWRWLAYIPGFPLPGPGTRYMDLPL